jgi:hypothetical protein
VLRHAELLVLIEAPQMVICDDETLAQGG